MSIRKGDLSMPFPTLGDDPWQRDAVNRALAVFGDTRSPSRIFSAVRAGPRVIEYFEQAPVLASIGLANRCIEAMSGGDRLKSIIKMAGGANVLRKFAGRVCQLSRDTMFRRLAKMNPSVLAQAIPEDAPRQNDFLTNATHAFSLAEIDPGSALEEWFIGRIAPEDRLPAGSVIDYIKRSGRQIDLRWSSDEALVATARWHDELAKMTSEERFLAKFKISFDDEVDYGAFPVSWERDGLAFVALRSGLALFEEGRKMHHCVGSYVGDVLGGGSRIYSIRQGDRRLATMEIRRNANRTWSLAQLCGPCNARPPDTVQIAARVFAALAIKRLGGTGAQAAA